MENPHEDLRELTAVLQDIMPVLDRIQNRSPQPGAVLFGGASVETLAAVALVGDLGADSLRRLTGYLDAHAKDFPGLEHCAPVVAGAARALAARNYAQAFALLFDVYRTITMMRLEDNTLPAPGSVAPRLSERRSQGGEGAPH
jgi:hypothetical protein